MNYCGFAGSFLADGLLQIFGIMSWLFVLCFVFWGLESLLNKNKSTTPRLRWLWFFLMALTLCALSAVYFPQTRIFQNQISAGGILGLATSQTLVKWFNPIGLQVVLWTAFLILVVFLSERSIVEMLSRPKGALIWLFSKPFKIKLNLKWPDRKTKIVTASPAEKSAPNFQMISGASQNLSYGGGALSGFKLEMPFLKTKKENLAKPSSKIRANRHVEHWELPKLSLVSEPPQVRVKIEEKEIKRKAELLKEKLAHFSVTGEVVAARPGPAVTLFEFKPDVDVKLSRITELEDDLSLALSSESLRIIAPIPGRDVVGIETSNSQRETVFLKESLADDQFWRDDFKLPISLGKQVDGEQQIVDLRKLPHLMVAGTTGSGKSVFVVSTITSFLFKHSPKTLRLLLIDPKQVDLAAFEKIPHLVMPLVTDSKQAVLALKWAVREMEKRYRSMSRFGARGLEAFNENIEKMTGDQKKEHDKINLDLEEKHQKADQYYTEKLPYLVIVIEEFGDLMSVDKNNVEHSVVRLAQKARACGIHLILAMQSPRKEIITGLIKTNIPGRISFKVSSSMDSRIILDEKGAERLLAQGDLLYRNPGGSNLIRHHAPFLKDEDVTQVARFWSDQGAPEFNESALRIFDLSAGDDLSLDDGPQEPGDSEESDEKYDEIVAWASTQKEISASLVQRRFQLGYPRAARMIETFEKRGIVGPSNGSKPRQVLISQFGSLHE